MQVKVMKSYRITKSEKKARYLLRLPEETVDKFDINEDTRLKMTYDKETKTISMEIIND